MALFAFFSGLLFIGQEVTAEASGGSGNDQENRAVDRKDLFIRTAVAELIQGRTIDPEKMAMHVGTGIDYFDLVSYIGSDDSGQGKWQAYCPHANASIDQLAEKYRIRGGHSTNVSACVASTQAMGLWDLPSD